ncbi:MAG TPA: hypothetical protein VI653_30030 [Steroidobacteraceae bacterium]
MKISSDPGMVSALETWLRDTANLDIPAPGVAPSQASLSGETASQVFNNGPTAPRDSAEGLLELDVWKGAPDGSRLLTSSALFQPRAAEPAGVIQGWTEHIFQPLV